MVLKSIYSRLILSFVFTLSLTALKSQNSLSPIPPPNDFRFEDLWNVTVIVDNPSQYTSLYIQLRVFDNNKGLLVESKSNSFTLLSGSKTFSSANLNELSPFEYPYRGSSVLNSIIQRGGLFPAGDYKMDYTFFGRTSNGTTTELARNTINHSVLMPSFLQLVSVYDEDTIKEENPIFMWMPASATKTVGGIESEKEYKLTYTISVAEVLKNQTPYMAITSNPTYYSRSGLEATIEQYPFSARKFEPCTQYAWQVKGVVNGQTVINSEIWTFNTPCEKEIIIPDAPVLVKHREDLAICYVKNNTVHFAYYEEYNIAEGAQLKASIYNSKREEVNTAEQLNLTVKKGYNTYTLNTCPKGANLLNGENYLLVITNAKNEKWYLRIINNQATNDCY